MSQDREDERAAGRRSAEGAAGAANGSAPRRPIDAGARARIGRGLRLHYAAVLDMPIPERLRTLIDDLAACSDTEATR